MRQVDAVKPVPTLALAALFLAAIAGLLAAVLSDNIAVAGRHEATLAVVAVPVLAGAMVLLLYRLELGAARRRLVRAAFERCAIEPPTADELAELAELRAAAEPLTTAVHDELERAYTQLVHVIVADGVADDHELERLARTEAALELPESRIRAARMQGFLDVYDRAIEDSILTREEEASIEHIREALGVSAREVRRELAFARQLARARQVREEPLTPVRASVRLHRHERAYYVTMGTEKKPVVRTYPRSGRQEHERAFQSMRAGNLIITGERVLFESGSIESLPLRKILEVCVDAESKYLVIYENRQKHPHFFDVPQPYMAMAYLERALEHADWGPDHTPA